MSKVICDVCGTAYPETATQCPICGCAKPENARTVSSDASAETGGVNSYTYVKGGRFSKANVRKRNKAAAAAQKEEQQVLNIQEPEQGSSNRGLIIAIILLALAILAVIAYIFVNFLGVGGGDKPTDPADTTTTAIQQTTTEDTTPISIVCTDLTLSTDTIELDAVGDAWLINAIPTPKDTTDQIVYVTSDSSVATVTEEGRVTAVGPGEAVITITCGEAEAECTVVCNIEIEPTTEETTEATTAPETDGDWDLRKTDITFSAKDASYELYRGDVSKSLITFTSDDEEVAVFENGEVIAVGPGTTKVHAEYNGEKKSCIIRCAFKAEETDSEAPTDGATAVDPTTLKLSHEDVTLGIGKSFVLRLRDSAGNVANVTWTVSKNGVCEIEGNKITGEAEGTVTVSCTYKGTTYKCIVRVNKNA